ncbi:3253_t:CDS:1, partial [Paraglomus occultum]
LLKQKNARLLAENTELRNKNAKLRQDIEGHEARIMKLEQRKSITNVSQSSVCEAGYSVSNINSSEMEISNDTPISDITDDALNSDIYCTEPKSSEDKEMNDFLDSTY